MTDTTTNLALPLLVQGQAQKEIWHNEALAMLDALVHCMVKDKDLVTPPVSPVDGERWIVAAAATGAWAGKSTQIALRRDGAWSFLVPKDGHIAFVDDEAKFYVFNSAIWADLSGLITALQNLTLLGVNTTADVTNKLSVASSAVLLNHIGAGIQAKLNKAAAANTASFLFQTAFSGRAEFGLIGSDNFVLKVSPDGSTFHDVFTVDRTTGQATFADGAVQIQVDVVTASGAWAKPAWAKRFIAFATGAGGGGGSGRRGAAASDRRGGGGGGAGGLNRAEWLASEIGASLTVTIGIGGTAGPAAAVNDTNGTVGGTGGDTFIVDAATEILRAGGGAGGGAGTATTVAGGASGYGDGGVGNAGGAGGSTTGGVGASTTLGAGPGGGGGGGGISTTNVVGAGGTGAYGHFSGGAGRRAAQVAGAAAGLGGNGGAAKAWARGAGSGGAGGGAGDAAGTANGGAGGAGGIPGGGAGGGAASTNGASSGAGGVGGRGEVWFMSIG